MKKLLCCTLFLLVSSSVKAYPASQPVYHSPQYISAQAVPAYTFKSSQAQPQYNIQPQIQSVAPQYVRAQVPAVTPVYENEKEGLQNYGSQGQSPVQQVQKPLHITPPIYLSQIQSSKLVSEAQEVLAAIQKQTANPTQRPITKVFQPTPSYTQAIAQPTRPQPQQYVRVQPQVRYTERPAPPQYRLPQPKQQLSEKYEEEKEDYDPNPSYQFGFDVKDDLYTNYQNRKEQREGNKITGSYSVVDSDGYIRTVQYTADPKEGFKAEVTRQPTDIVVKIPKPQPQFQNNPRQQLQYIQEAPIKQQPQRTVQQEQKQPNIIYQYQ